MAASPHTAQSQTSAAPSSQGGPDGNRDMAETGDYYGVMAHGLPYDATKNEVAEFFSGCRIKNGHEGIHILVGQDGRPQGDAVIELEGQEDLDKAKQLNNQMMGRRYIEISPLSRAAADQSLASQPGGGSGTEFVVRLRGLPYSATSRDVLDLLNDCQVAGGDKGVRFSFAPDGRPSGEAFVELVSEEDVSKALGHNKEHMGKRYVEIFRATKGQLEWEGRMAEKVGGGTGGVVRLRGLPFKCTEEDIRQFFQDMPIPAGGVTMQVDSENRGTGEAYVEFVKPEDAEKALYKNRQMMGHRYIEVFRSTHAEVRPMAVKETRWRGTPYSRPPPTGQWGGDRGGYGGYGGYGAGGYGLKFGGGYDRGGRGRGRGMMRGGGGGGYNNYGDGGGGPGYAPYSGGGYNYNPQPGYGQYNSGYGGGGPGGGAPDPQMVAYPIRPGQGGRGGFDDTMDKPRHGIKMRGLPYSAKEEDIMKFFQPHAPCKVVVEFDQYERPSGNAEVFFNTHEEAEKAMEKHNGHMGHRYIELFLMSRPGGDGGGMGGRDVGGGGEYMDRGVGRGGAAGATRYPAQTSWGDARSAQPQGMYGGSAPASQQQPQQYMQPSYGGYQQQQPAQPQATQQWPQQGGYQSSGGYQQQAQQQSYQPQTSYQQQTQPVSGYQQPAPGQDAYSQAQTQWY